jgi:hypothetical protein
MRTIVAGLVGLSIGAVSVCAASWALQESRSSGEEELNAEDMHYAVVSCALTSVNALRAIRTNDLYTAETLLAKELSGDVIALHGLAPLVAPASRTRIDGALKTIARFRSEFDLTSGHADEDQIVASILRRQLASSRTDARSHHHHPQ